MLQENTVELSQSPFEKKENVSRAAVKQPEAVKKTGSKKGSGKTGGGGALLGWLAWGCGALFYAYQFTLRVAPSVMANDLMRDLSLDACSFGLLASIYYYGYALFQVPSGSLLDIFGARRVVLSFIFMCAVGALCFMSPYLWLVYVGRLLIGIGSAVSFLACVKIAATYFAPERMAFITGLSVLIGTLGALGGGAPLAHGVSVWGWRPLMGVLVLMAVGLFVASFVWVKKPPVEEKPAEQTGSLLEQIKSLLTNGQTWIIALYGVLMYVPLSAFCDLWGPASLMALYDLSATEAAFLVSVVYIGLGVGAPLSSLVLAFVKSYRLCFWGSSLLGALSFAMLLVGFALPYAVLFVLMLVIGLAIAPQIMAFPLVTQLNPARIAGTASGFHNMICMLSGVIAQPLVGSLLKSLVPLGGVPQARDFAISLTVVPIALGLAFLVTFFVRPVRYVSSA